MKRKNPDKYIRAGLYNKLNGIIIDGKTIPVYDSNTPNNDDFAIILSTQSGSDNNQTKCSQDLNRSILIDVFTRLKGHAGSRAFLDDIVERVLQELDTFTVDFFNVQYKNVSYPGDMSLNTTTETIHRKIINLSINLKQHE